MTYGWALVVIVIVVAALVAFGVFNPASSCTPQSSDGKLLVKDSVITGGSIQLKLQNNSGAAMTGVDTNTTPSLTEGSNPTTLSRGGDGTFTYTGTITAGQSYVIDVSYVTNGLTHPTNITCTAGTV